MNTEYKIKTLREAQELLYQAINLIEQAVGDDLAINSYLIAPLKIHAGAGHGYLTNDLNIDEVIEKLESGKK